MKLHYSPTSPYARKVLVLIRETGLQGVEVVHSTGNPLDPGTMPIDQNPLGKIPALERPDEPALYDSRVICRYLDMLTGRRMYPAPPSLWDTLTIEATADGMVDAAILMVYETRLRPEELRFDPWIEGQWAKIDRALDALETRWMPQLTGAVDMGQIAVGCALGYLDFRLGPRNWRATRPHLAAWYETFSARPSMQATVPAA